MFKTMNEEHFGELSFFRIYSGSVQLGSDLFNSDRKITERIGQIYMLNGHDAHQRAEARRRATSARW